MIIIVLILDIGGCRVSLDDPHPNYFYVWFIFIVNSSSTDRILDFAKPLSSNFQIHHLEKRTLNITYQR